MSSDLDIELKNNKMFDYIQELRKKLLDLTAKNRLLNFPLEKKVLRIINEVPDELYNMFLSEKGIQFLPIPEPKKEELIKFGYIVKDCDDNEIQLKEAPKVTEWAEVLGIKTSYTLPEPSKVNLKFADPKLNDKNAIQVLLFQKDLDARLDYLYKQSKSAVEESGAEILYFSIGFLKWFDSDSSNKEYTAPLFIIPVRLQRGKQDIKDGLYKYHLFYAGDDILPNVSLKEKLQNDFGLVLPELSDGIKPEDYILQVANIMKKHKPKWDVKRYATLGLLNFSKMSMYLDLDPKTWPQDENNLLCHDILQRFFISKEAEDISLTENLSSNEYAIDSSFEIHNEAPLIYDADSSQHSALIDVQKGNNLVIEGPPGSGKSQTIANIIAASLLKGKKILFVAEKMAALDVVKERLDKAGLGKFCLELHSHKAKKRQVLDSLSERLKTNQDTYSEEEISHQIRQLEKFKDELNNYAQLINKEWANTGFTIHQILCKSIMYQERISINPKDLYVENITSAEFNKNYYSTLIDAVCMFKSIYHECLGEIGENSNINKHPWNGVYKTKIEDFEYKKIFNSLVNWQDKLSNITQNMVSFLEHWKILDASKLTTTIMEKLVSSFNYLPPLTENKIFILLPKLNDNESISSVYSYVLSFKNIQLGYEKLTKKINPEHLFQVEQNIMPDLNINQLDLWGVSATTSINDLVNLCNRLKNNHSIIKNKYLQLQDLKNTLPDDIVKFMTPDKKGLDFIVQFFSNLIYLPTSLLHLRNDYFDEDKADLELGSINSQLTEIRTLKNKLENIFNLNKLLSLENLYSISNILSKKHFFSFFSPQFRKAKKELLSMSASSLHYAKLQRALPELINYIENLTKFSQNDYSSMPFAINIDTDIESLILVRDWYKEIRKCYGIGFGSQVKVGSAILKLDANIIKGIHILVEKNLDKDISKTIHSIIEDFSILPAILPDISNTHWLEENGLLLTITKKLELELINLQDLFTDGDITVQHIRENFSLIKFIIDEQVKNNNKKELQFLHHLNLNLVYGCNKQNEFALNVLEKTLLMAKFLLENVKPIELANCIRNIGTLENYHQLYEAGKQLNDLWDLQKEAKNCFIDYAQLNEVQWFHSSSPSLDFMISRNQIAISKEKWLKEWINFLEYKEEMSSLGLLNIWQAVMNEQLPIDKIEDGLNAAVFRQLSKEMIKEQPDLTRYSGKKLNALQERFVKYDKDLLILQRQRIANNIAKQNIPQGFSGGKKSEYTELSLIRHEIGKKARHIPIRQLINRSGKALQVLKPCFMMSPMSVANYLPPGQMIFDLIVMDEASQIKPEDALGVIARGKQIVVVGDPKQLPPTNFFERASTNEEDDDAVVLSQTDSILDAAIPLFKTRRLRWHYRSQHEHLIAFSNHHFYDNDLIIFPSPNARTSELGISFNYVSNGQFINQCNINEAKSIVDAVIAYVKNNSKETIGIVAMSSKQRDQIEQRLEYMKKNDKHIEQIIDTLESKGTPLFVKNLENVQGDERDVIFISFTYGPSEVGGIVYQRFGPINTDVGWRRLNVLLTRSRRRMNVFSSMKSEDILTSNASSKGVIALKNFLKFADTKKLNTAIKHTGKLPDSDFEISVIEFLEKAGFKCEPQVGVSGFYLDIAVIDPIKPGRYLMGIECDGATYHSAKSARDRDRLRQEILEGLGWRIRRIWSTDWFSNPEEAIEPIIRELNQLINKTSVNNKEINDVEVIFDEIKEHAEIDFDLQSADLKSRLLKLSNEIINKMPNTPDEERLLRPAMVEVLLEFKPITKTEFLNCVPLYLRNATDKKEAKLYLDQVLSMFSDHV